MNNTICKPPIVVAPLVEEVRAKNLAMKQIAKDIEHLRLELKRFGMDPVNAFITELIADQKLAALRDERQALLDKINRFSVSPEDN